MSPRTATTLVRGFAYPECPRWHDGWLWFSDQHDGYIRAMTANGLITLALEIPGRPSGLGWLPNGDLLVTSMEQRCLYRWNGEQLSLHADLSALHPGESNDMVVAANGNAYVGNIGFDFNGGEEPRPTTLVQVSPDGQCREAASDLTCPNGAVITEDQRLIIAESLAHRITQFDIGPEGELLRRRLFAQLNGHVPDGICLDEEGCIWAAIPFAGEVVRITEGGEILDRIAISGANPYACILGGDDRRSLFICCAPDHDPTRTLALRGGRIDVARVKVAGAGLP